MERYVGPLRHPGKKDPCAWQPGNEAASEYTVLRVLWENFDTQFSLAKRDSNEYTRKLALKFACVELRSFLDAIPRYSALVSRIPAHNGVLPRAVICLTEAERDDFHKKSKALSQNKKALLKTLNKLRNSVGAHMSRPLLIGASDTGADETLTWAELDELWSLLEPRMFMEIGRAGEAFLRSAMHLPIHEYYRQESPTALRLHIPAVAQQVGTELRFTAISPSVLKQVEQLMPQLVEGSCIVFRREPIRLGIGWPEDIRAKFPVLPDSVDV